MGTYREERGYVNIYGRDLNVCVCEGTGKLLIPLDELKPMGYCIYRKSQYSKLLIDDSEFTREFELYLLQAAQTYMLENKITFREEEIIENINKAKARLTGDFARNHVIQAVGEQNISITTTVTPTSPIQLRQPSPLTQQNLQTHNFGNRNQRNEPSNNNCQRNFNDRKSEQHNGFVNNARRNNFREASPPGSTGAASADSGSKKPGFGRAQNGETRYFPQPEKLLHVPLDKPQHKLLVTYMEKPNVMWVQDHERTDVVIEIMEKAAMEAKTALVLTKYQLNTVYLATYEDVWYRAKIIKFKPLIACFIDYGNNSSVDEIREASADLAQYPCQANKITFNFGESEVEDGDIIHVKIKKQFPAGTYLVEVLTSDDPAPQQRPTPPTVRAPTLAPQVESFTPQPETFFERPPPLFKLENDQKVLIASENEGKLAVRTRDSYSKLKNIEEALTKIETIPVTKVSPNQLVLCTKDGKLRRAVVTKVRGATAEVELLDEYHKMEANVSTLKHMPKSMALEPVTYVLTPEIKGARSNPAIDEWITLKSKLTVVMSRDHFDLQLGDKMLSEKLNPDAGRVMMSHLNSFKPKLGLGNYILQTYRSATDFTLADALFFTEHGTDLIIDTIDNDEPYVPIVGEVCLGIYLGTWSRCMVTNCTADKYEVQFFDFGNTESLGSKQLRRLPEDLKNILIIGIQCQLTELARVKNSEDDIKESLKADESYEVIIKKQNGDVYEVEFPGVLD